MMSYGEKIILCQILEVHDLLMHMKLLSGLQKIRNQNTFNYQSLKCLNDDLQMRSDWTLPICNGKRD